MIITSAAAARNFEVLEFYDHLFVHVSSDEHAHLVLAELLQYKFSLGSTLLTGIPESNIPDSLKYQDLLFYMYNHQIVQAILLLPSIGSVLPELVLDTKLFMIF